MQIHLSHRHDIYEAKMKHKVFNQHVTIHELQSGADSRRNGLFLIARQLKLRYSATKVHHSPLPAFLISFTVSINPTAALRLRSNTSRPFSFSPSPVCLTTTVVIFLQQPFHSTPSSALYTFVSQSDTSRYCRHNSSRDRRRIELILCT